MPSTATIPPSAVPSVPRARDIHAVSASTRRSATSVALRASGCVTPLGDAGATAAAMICGKTALRLTPVRGCDGGDAVPLALCNEWQPATGDEPRWADVFFRMIATAPDRPWGTERHPILIASSNFGIDNLYAHHRHPREGQLPYILPQRLTAYFTQRLGWGSNVTHFSHACVSANLALLYASRHINAGLADEVLVVSYDFLSPFVTGGFHAMKILTGEMPAPYADRPFGAIGLGDGAAFAVLGKDGGCSDLRLEAQDGRNEMYHFTGNHPDGVGMAQLGASMRRAVGDRPVWVKGHGTGTIEAGKLEARHMAECFPNAPLVGWKGALGHTLGSCGLVELALAVESIRLDRAPGTVGTTGPAFTPNVATEPFDLSAYAGVVLNAFAFGGAHYACLLTYD